MDTVDLTHLAVLVPMGERIQRLEKMNVGDEKVPFLEMENRLGGGEQ